ncbi:MAG: DUF4382 domain-containing protein [Spirochaetes bacterium]|nr:DUF4382 domain-containing protein [Spirochaetota bacterium]MBU1080676.1 DUF4382 domain-containing protein [Spirochaetota bacterium]
MKSILRLGLAALAAIALAGACADSTAVSVGFALTDAPIDEATVTEVNVTVSSVAVNESADASIADGDGSWKVLTLEPAQTLNLLALQNGIADELGALVMTGGTQINQIRLGVGAVEIVDGGTRYQASIPSATGLKIVNAFQVPLTGAVTITVDFDVRKSIIEKPNGTFTVKPVLRAVVDNEAGRITGTVPTGTTTVYAYADGTYVATEATTATADDGLFFTGAYTSTCVKADLSYVLAFLEAGVYDLYGVDATGAVTCGLGDVAVAAGGTTPSAALVAVP